MLHCFEYGARGPIGLRAVQSAARIVLWHTYSAQALLAPFTLSRETANAATLDRWLIDRCQMEGVEGFPTRDVLNGGPNGTRKSEDFDKALEILAFMAASARSRPAGAAPSRSTQPCWTARLRTMTTRRPSASPGRAGRGSA